MRLVLVCGPWSSGTSAVTEVLGRLGGWLPAPYYGISDTRHPNTFETASFRDLILQLVDEERLALKPCAAEAAAASLAAYRRRLLSGEFGEPAPVLVLKHPAAGFFLPQICETFDTRLVYVIRRPNDIEATRRRRGWHAAYGAQGAEAIYPRLFAHLVDGGSPTMLLRYDDLVAQPVDAARALAVFAGLPLERAPAAATAVAR